MKTTITFPSRDSAKQFAIAWGRRTLRGHSLSATLPDGTAKLTLDEITPEIKAWIDAEIAKLNG